MEAMVEDKLISVIIPVYNVEKYIGKCIESVLSQTYKNLEIILVNDGSSDQSGAICDEYSSKDDRIVVIHQMNQGVSKARNAGLEAAKGDYIAFCDSDDWIEADMYQYLYSLLVGSSCNISSCGAFLDSPGSSVIAGCSGKEVIEFDAENAIAQLHLRKKMSDWSVVKLYKRETIEQLKFDEKLKVCEDYKFVCLAIENSTGVVCGNEAKYHYVQRKESVSNKGYTEEFEKGLSVRKEFMDRYNIMFPNRKKEIMARYILESMGILTAMIKGDNIVEERKNEIVNFIRKHLLGYLTTSGVDLYFKASAIVIAVNFKLFSRIYIMMKTFDD